MSEKSDVTMEVMDTPEAKSLNPNDMDAKESGTKKKSTLDYLLQLLSDSVVTGVPQIITVGNLLRKIFKILVLGACISGFIYQAVEFMNLYKTYPSSLEIEMKYSENLPIPAVTICNRNSVKRKEFCKAKKEYCAKPTNRTHFCNMYPHQCNENTTVDDLEFVISDAFIERTDVETYGHGRDMIDECCLDLFPERDQCRAVSKQTVASDMDNVEKRCYTIDFSKVNMDDTYGTLDEAFQAGRNSCLLWSGMEIEQSYAIMINLDPYEITRPDRKPSAQAVVHSRNDPQNPFVKGFTMEEGKQYTVTMKAYEEYLLPGPYSTNCTENKKLGEDYNRKQCILQCAVETFTEECGCVPLSVLTDGTIPVCDNQEILNCLAKVTGKRDCSRKCPRLCHSSYFEYKVSSSKIENSIKPVDLGDGPIHIDKESINEEKASEMETRGTINSKGKTLLKIVYSTKEITIYTYKPKYEKIEILGYIGGFSGIWLGVSLVAIFDFFETIVVFIVHVIKRAKTKNEHGRR